MRRARASAEDMKAPRIGVRTGIRNGARAADKSAVLSSAASGSVPLPASAAGSLSAPAVNVIALAGAAKVAAKHSDRDRRAGRVSSQVSSLTLDRATGRLADPLSNRVLGLALELVQVQIPCREQDRAARAAVSAEAARVAADKDLGPGRKAGPQADRALSQVSNRATGRPADRVSGRIRGLAPVQVLIQGRDRGRAVSNQARDRKAGQQADQVLSLASNRATGHPASRLSSRVRGPVQV